VRDISAKELEPALRVPDPGQQHGLDQEVENLAHQHAVDRLRHLDSRSTQGPRRDCHAGALVKLSLQLLELLDRSREVGVRDEDLRTSGRRDALSKGTALAAVLRQRLQPHELIALSGGVHDQACAVGAPVIDQDQLVVEVLIVEVPLDLLDGAGQPLLLVVAGDDDAEHDPPSYLPALRTLIA